jgi:hypothetical protein
VRLVQLIPNLPLVLFSSQCLFTRKFPPFVSSHNLDETWHRESETKLYCKTRQKRQQKGSCRAILCHVTARPGQLNGTSLSLPLSLHLMATHIVSWGGKEHIASPVVSSTKPSIVSIVSMLPHKRETSSVVQEAPRAAGSHAKHMSPSLFESSGSETSVSASTYSRAGAGDDSFIRHHKYFFEDGNLTFLVRRVQA